MCIRLLIILLLLITSIKGFSQDKIKGEVRDSAGQAIENVNVILLNIESNQIITYGVSDKQGVFFLNYSIKDDSLKIKATCIGFATKELVIRKGLATIKIILSQAVSNLQDVVIKPPPKAISLKKDTINYNVSAFADSSARVAIDIIKKLPGISVGANGQISYNNKAINKFYIEGQDLLEGRYNIASNNLPSKDIETIQVIPDHQPVKVLDGIVISDRAALNIKLKNNSKARLLGTIDATIAAPLKYRDVNISLLEFSKDLQFINTIKTNNIGNNLDQEITYHNVSPSFLESGGLNTDLVSLIKPEYPQIDENRFRFNNNSLVTTNELIKLNKNTDLKISGGYEYDRINERPSSITKIFLANDTINIPENHDITTELYKKFMGAILESNSVNFYFKENVQFQQLTSSSTDVITPDTIHQTLKNPHTNVVNDVNGIVKSGSNMFYFSSFSSFNNLPQQLRVSPGLFADSLNAGIPYNEIFQKIQLKGFYTNNSLSYGKILGRFVWNNTIGMTKQIQDLTNELYKNIPSGLTPIGVDYSNKTHKKRLKLYDDLSLTYSKKDFSGSIFLKSNYNDLSNTSHGQYQSAKNIFINPELDLKFKLNNTLENTLSFSTANNLTDNINNSYVLTNYRTLTDNNTPISELKSSTIAYNLSYQNVVTGVFVNFNVVYTHSNANIIAFDTYNGITSVTNFIVRNNPANNFLGAVSVNKYYEDIKTNIVLGANYDFSETVSIQQGILTNSRNNNYKFSLKLNTSLNEIFTIDYKTEYLINTAVLRQVQLVTSYPSIKEFSQNADLKIFFNKYLQGKLSTEYFYNDSGVLGHTNNFFTDINLMKTLAKPKMDVSFGISNIFNSKNLVNSIYSENILTVTNYPLRERTLFLKIAYQF